jgi:uncharacterized membrane protein
MFTTLFSSIIANYLCLLSQGIHVLWTPQDENDVLTEEMLLADYPHLRPHKDD